MPNTIEFDLITNAIDSIEHAVDLIAYDQEIDKNIVSKRAFVSISHAIELLLKERLRIIHPSLIWDNIDKYPDLDSRTVSTEKALLRLENIGGVKFEEKDQRLLRSLRKVRNSIEHYKWSISEEESEYILGSALSFAVSFLKDHLGKDILGYAERDGGILRDLLSKNERFATEYEIRLQSEFGKAPNFQCKFCKALLEKNDSGACPKCGHWNYFGDGFDEAGDVPF